MHQDALVDITCTKMLLVESQEVAEVQSTSLPKTKETSLKRLPDDNIPEGDMTMHSSPAMITENARYVQGPPAFNIPN